MGFVKNLIVRAGADFSAITNQANKAKASMHSMQTSVSKDCSLMSAAAKATTKVFGLLGVGLSAAALISAAKSAKEAYDEQSEASAKLARVMRNTMGARSDELRSIENLIDAQEQLGVVDGATQTEAAQELSTYLTLSGSLKTLLPVLNDMVAQQYGMSASAESAVSIATMMGKVMNGQTSALSRYGYSFTATQEAILKYGNEAQRAATLAEVVEESVGGMNEALAATPSGRLKQVSFTLGKIQESFGQAVNSIAVLFLPAMNTVCNVLASAATLANRLAQTFANVFGRSSQSQTAAAVKYTGAVANSVDGITDSAGAAKKAMQALMGFDQIKKLSDTSSVAPDTDTAFGGGGGTITEVLDVDTSDAAESIGWLETALQPLKASIEEIQGLLGNISGLLSGNKTFGEFLSSLTPAQTALLSIAASLATIAIISGAMTGLNAITTFFASVKSLNAVGLIGKLAEVFYLTAGGAGTLHEAIQAVFGPSSIIAGVATIIGGAVLALTNFAGMLKNGFSWAREALMLLGIALAAVGAVILGAPALIAGVIAAIVAAVATSVVLIKQHWAEVKADAKANMEGVKKEISAKIESIKSIFKGLLMVLKGLFTGDLKTILDGVKTMAKGVINNIISNINVLIRGFNTIVTPLRLLIVEAGKLAGKSWTLSDISIPTIPHLATGGVVSRPTTALIGERGPEAVVPLSDNAEWMDSLASRIVALITLARPSGPTKLTIPVYVGGRKVTEVVVDDINEITNTTGVCPIRI